MRDKYVGDVGDYGKYGLLRALASPPVPDGQRNLSLGVVWYKVVGGDGTSTEKPRATYGYLQQGESFRDCDQPLFEALKRVVQSKRKTVRTVELSGILPPETAFYGVPLATEGRELSPVARLGKRARWVRGALDHRQGHDIVFVDPDTGLDVGIRPQSEKAAKYAFFDELTPYLCRGQSLVIYQHLNPHYPLKGQVDQINERIAEIKARLQASVAIALLFKPLPRRAFFILPNKTDEDILSRRINRFLQGPWCEYFRRVG